MRTAVLSTVALAAGASAWTGPGECEPDNCYRNMIDDRFKAEVPAFCHEYLVGTTTAASAIPTYLNNCAGDVEAVSSACSCIDYTPPPTTTSVPPTSTPYETTPTTTPYETTTPEYTPTYPASSSPSSSYPIYSTGGYTPSSSYPVYTPSYTTSTIYSTYASTITSCAPEVEYCPGKPDHPYTTTCTTSWTTVCEVTPTSLLTYSHSQPTYPAGSPPPVTTYPGTGAGAAPTYSAKPSAPVVAGAAKAGTGFLAAAVAFVAALL